MRPNPRVSVQNVPIHTTSSVQKTERPSHDVSLLIPDDDAEDPELSIVVPALNEELTIGEFVAWCQEGLEKAGIVGEILIVDSSTDRTASIALDNGARVLKTPKRGLGRAYIDALPHIRGRAVLMGDADCTYDFRELAPFVDKFREGYEFIMGSRFKGYIEPGSMPALHRYFGTPVTTWILNRLYSSRFSDIHCGMRGVTREALQKMRLRSQSWEYASEMILKSVHMNLRTSEVPVRFLKDQPGRLSHHRRTGWFSPWLAGWINLRAMFIYGVDFFTLKPGFVMMMLGLLIALPLSFGPITIGSVTFSLNTMLLGLALVVVGLQSFLLGCLAQTLYDYSGRARDRWMTIFEYTRSVLLSGIMFLLGLGMMSFLGIEFFRNCLSLPETVGSINHLAVVGILFVIASFTVFTFTLILHAAALSDEWANRGGS